MPKGLSPAPLFGGDFLYLLSKLNQDYFVNLMDKTNHPKTFPMALLFSHVYSLRENAKTRPRPRAHGV